LLIGVWSAVRSPLTAPQSGRARLAIAIAAGFFADRSRKPPQKARRRAEELQRSGQSSLNSRRAGQADRPCHQPGGEGRLDGETPRAEPTAPASEGGGNESPQDLLRPRSPRPARQVNDHHANAAAAAPLGSWVGSRRPTVHRGSRSGAATLKNERPYPNGRLNRSSAERSWSRDRYLLLAVVSLQHRSDLPGVGRHPQYGDRTGRGLAPPPRAFARTGVGVIYLALLGTAMGVLLLVAPAGRTRSRLAGADSAYKCASSA
jgi:hypothetical protein